MLSLGTTTTDRMMAKPTLDSCQAIVEFAHSPTQAITRYNMNGMEIT